MNPLPKPPDSPLRRRVDYLFGAALPILLLAIDPVVFQSRLGLVGGALLGPLKAGCYTATAVFIASLIWWLRTGRQPAWLAGVLTAGCCFALSIGIVLLPFSLMGLMAMGIGLLGLTPFVMAWVYGRQAVRAFAAASGVTRRVRDMVIGFALTIAISGGVQLGARAAYRTAVESALASRGTVPPPGVMALRIFSPLVDLDQMVESYADESDPVRREAYKRVYAAVTGDDIEDRLKELAD